MKTIGDGNVRVEKVKYCEKCFLCVNDCKQFEELSNCIYYEKGFTVKQYCEMLKEDNVNLKRACTKYGVSFNNLMHIFKGHYHLTFRYRKMLNDILFERTEYIRYVKEFSIDGK